MNIEEIRQHQENQHAGNSSEKIKSIVYGGIDGVITTFCIIASGFGASIGFNIIIIIGLSNIIADGLSMAFGDFISSKLEKNYIETETAKEIYEYHNSKEHEILELTTLYESKGMKVSDANTVVNILVKYEDIFIQNMVLFELGFDSNTNSNKEIIKTSLFTFVSFICFGFIPLCPYLIGYFIVDRNENNIFYVSTILSTITLFSVGVFAGKITKQSKTKNGFFTLINGIIASSIAFVIGYGFEKLIL